jgi:hypothetical protein
MAGIIQVGTVDYTEIHFSDRFPVVATPCGKRGPSTDRWRYVTCVPCLERAPNDPRIRARLAAVLEEQRQRQEGGLAGEDPPNVSTSANVWTVPETEVARIRREASAPSSPEPPPALVDLFREG